MKKTLIFLLITCTVFLFADNEDILDLQELCEDTDEWACYDLGIAYSYGESEGIESVPIDINKSMTYFRKLCNEKSTYIYREAPINSSGDACVEIGKHYEKIKALQKAEQIYSFGCNQQRDKSCAALGDLYGKYTPLYNKQKSINAYKSICNEKSTEGCFSLANIYRFGEGVPVNYTKAKEYLQKECNEHKKEVIPCIFLKSVNEAIAKIDKYKQGIDVNKKDKEGKTPLMLNSYSTQICSALLKGGANINEQDKYLWTALIGAVFHNRVEMVKLLLDNGANPNLETNKHKTALYYAIKNNNLPIVRMLLEKKANLRYVLQEGLSLLQYTLINEKHKLIEVILKNEINIDLNFKNNFYEIRNLKDGFYVKKFDSKHKYKFINTYDKKGILLKSIRYPYSWSNTYIVSRRIDSSMMYFEEFTQKIKSQRRKTWYEKNGFKHGNRIDYGWHKGKEYIVAKSTYKNGILYNYSKTDNCKKIIYDPIKNITTSLYYYSDWANIQKGSYNTPCLKQVKIKSVYSGHDISKDPISLITYTKSGGIIEREEMHGDKKVQTNELYNNLLKASSKYQKERDKGILYYMLDFQSKLGYQANDAKKSLDILINKVKKRVKLKKSYSKKEALKVMDTIGSVIKNYGIEYDHKHVDIISKCIINKQMDCDIISYLYITIADKLNLPLYGVNFPTHMALIWKDNRSKFYWEATTHSKGTLKQYSHLLKPTNSFGSVKKGAYGTALNRRELFAGACTVMSNTLPDLDLLGEKAAFSRARSSLDPKRNPYDDINTPNTKKEFDFIKKQLLKIYDKNDVVFIRQMINVYSLPLRDQQQKDMVKDYAAKEGEKYIEKILTTRYYDSMIKHDTAVETDVVSSILYIYKELGKYREMLSLIDKRLYIVKNSKKLWAISERALLRDFKKDAMKSINQ